MILFLVSSIPILKDLHDFFPSSQALDIYWRKCQYETYTLCKRLKQGWTPLERALVQSHLMNGVSQYHAFLGWIRDIDQTSRINCMPEWNLDFLEESHYGHSHSNLAASQHSGGSNASSSSRQWIAEVTHRCLICLGDLSRYLVEFLACPDLEIPHRYYLQAFQVSPAVGTPFNQLATLSGDRYHGLEATFYYLRG